MQRLVFIAIALVTVAASAIELPDAGAAGPGAIRSRARSSGQPRSRTYRSYSVSPSVSPENDVVPKDSSVGQDVTVYDPPAPAASRSARTTRSKPSYMRADSKARGRYGQ